MLTDNSFWEDMWHGSCERLLELHHELQTQGMLYAAAGLLDDVADRLLRPKANQHYWGLSETEMQAWDAAAKEFLQRALGDVTHDWLASYFAHFNATRGPVKDEPSLDLPFGWGRQPESEEDASDTV